MLDMQNNLKLNWTINQSLNQSMREKKKQKSVFTLASVRLSKNTTGEKKWSSNERFKQTEGKSLDKQIRAQWKKRRIEWSCHCNALHYI